jgi:hypothetical protein
VSGEYAGGGQFVALLLTMAPGMVATFSGFRIGRPSASRPLAQFAAGLYLPLATYSPVMRSTVKK